MVGTAVPSVPSPVTHTSQSLPSTGFDASALMLLAAVTVGAGVLGGAIAAGPKAIWARIKRESREIV